MSQKKLELDLELDLEPEEDDAEPFVVYDIASYPSDLTLDGIRDMWNRGDIEIPEFQRNFVWKVKQASLLIESFLLGLPVPQVFFYIAEDNKSLVIDGQQRILSTIYFFEGYFGQENSQNRRQVFRLSGLDERSPFYNKRFEDLDESSQRKLRQSVLRAINIRQLSPKSENTSIYHIFERLNTGGTPLKAQEIRNCVFRGELVTKLRELNSNRNWRLILGKEKFDAHQKDVELILRAFSLASNGALSYEKPMKEFLNQAMKNDQDATSAKVKKFVRNFPKVCEVIVNEIGEKPFHIRGPLNTSVLDAVIATLVDGATKIPKDISKRYQKLLNNEKFLHATYYGTSDVSVLQERFEIAKKTLIG